jgi:AcrR family transcriptional regulator
MSGDNKELTRDAIIGAASLVFSRYGYKKTTLEDITSYLNIGKTAIYYYFKNKEDIFKEVIKKEASNLKESLINETSKANNPLEKFTIFVHTRMSFLKRIGNYYAALRFDLMEQLDFINESRKDFDIIEIKIIEKILKDGCKSGHFIIDNIEETAATIAITFKSLEIPFFGRNAEFDYEPILNRLITILLNGILNPAKKK